MNSVEEPSYTPTNPSISGRGKSGVYWGNEPLRMTGKDAYGNAIAHDGRLIATLAHLSGTAGTIISAGILPFFGPLIFWLVYKDRPEYAFSTQNAKNALNFSLLIWLINTLGIIIGFVSFGNLMLVPAILLGITGLTSITYHSIASYQAAQGRIYHYPFARINFIRIKKTP